MLTEKQKKIVEKAVVKCDGSQEECVYAAVEAVLAAQPAAQPFSVTLDEARNVWRAVLRGLGGRAAQINPYDLQAVINAELTKRPAPQEASTVQYYCANCGHVSRHHDGGAGQCIGHAGCTCMRFAAQEAPAPSEQVGELVEKWPSSTCAECGKVMEGGRIRKCERGGECSWHIPHAIHAYIKRLAAVRSHTESVPPTSSAQNRRGDTGRTEKRATDTPSAQDVVVSVEDGAPSFTPRTVNQAPSAQESELVEIADKAYNGVNGCDPSFHYCDLRAALAAVRPQIEAERDRAWKKAVMEAFPDFNESVLLRIHQCLTPAQKPVERVVVCVHLLDDSFDGFDVRVNDQLIAQFTGKHEAERYAAGLRAEIGEKK
jgi:hypothetical protein